MTQYNVSARYSWTDVDFGDTFDHEWLPLGDSYTVRSWPTTWASKFRRRRRHAGRTQGDAVTKHLAGEVTGAGHGFFPAGARVLVDGRDEAIVKTCFPEGSTSYLWPHYKLDFVGGDRNVVVSIKRVGVDRKTNKTSNACCRESRILGGRCDNCGTWDES